jgi:hypothetical protein
MRLPSSSWPVGSQWIPFVSFDIRCEVQLHKKGLRGYWMDVSTQLTYSSVVTQDSIRIAFLIAALNDLDLLAADVGNLCPKFGPNNIGKTVIVVRTMYGLKSSGTVWHAKFSETLRDMGYSPTYSDPDVWYRPATKNNGCEYYDYILVYVDDILVMSAEPISIEGYPGPTNRLFRSQDQNVVHSPRNMNRMEYELHSIFKRSNLKILS